MVLPVIPILLIGLLSGSAAGLGVYYSASQRERDKWNRIVSNWLNIPIEDIENMNDEQRNAASALLDDVSHDMFGIPPSQLSEQQLLSVIKSIS